MSLANTLWGAPRIHGELLKLGIEIGQTSVAIHGKDEETPISRVEDVHPHAGYDEAIACAKVHGLKLPSLS